MNLLSIVVPCFNEDESVGIFLEEIQKTLKEYNFEVIYVNDGSSDNTLKYIKELASKNSNVKYISFSRNFGKESAIFAGLKYASGDYICLMDADLQHPPKLIPEMLEAVLDEGYDVAAARRVSRKGEPKIKSFFSHRFYKVFNRISDIDMVEGATDYRIMTRQVVDSVLNLPEYNRFSKGLFQWVGFDTSVIAFIYMLFIIIRYLIYSEAVPGYPTLICSLLLLGGIQLLSIGVLGKYLEKTYFEAKNRPIFIVKESNIDEE